MILHIVHYLELFKNTSVCPFKSIVLKHHFLLLLKLVHHLFHAVLTHSRFNRRTIQMN